jgi:hypothetical protein
VAIRVLEAAKEDLREGWSLSVDSTRGSRMWRNSTRDFLRQPRAQGLDEHLKTGRGKFRLIRSEIG